MIDTCTHKNVIKYQIEHEVHYVNKYLCKQRNFFANGADLLDRREI